MGTFVDRGPECVKHCYILEQLQNLTLLQIVLIYFAYLSAVALLSGNLPRYCTYSTASLPSQTCPTHRRKSIINLQYYRLDDVLDEEFSSPSPSASSVHSKT